MAKDPDDRHPTCSELVADARAALGLDSSPRSSRRWAIAAVVIVAALAAVVAVVVATRGGEPAAAAAAANLVRFDPSSLEVTARYPIAADPLHVAEESDQVWFSAGDALWRLDPRGGEVVKVDATGPIHDLVGYQDNMYVARDGKELLEGHRRRRTTPSAAGRTGPRSWPAASAPTSSSVSGPRAARTCSSSIPGRDGLNVGPTRDHPVRRTRVVRELARMPLQPDGRGGLDLGGG